jgi:uncharacterized membrane protein YjdF
MLPKNLEAWGFVFAACFIGFLIGQWLKTRRNKIKKNNDYVDGLRRRVLAETLDQKKKANRKRKKQPAL